MLSDGKQRIIIRFGEKICCKGRTCFCGNICLVLVKERRVVMEQMIQELIRYQPYNEQEAADKELMLQLLQTEPHIFERTCQAAHMTASAWVVNKDWTKVLLAYHNLYQSWAWLGGHADGEKDLLQVALREVQEESSIQSVVPMTEEIYSIEILPVCGHEKRGVYVPTHLHLNVTYLLQADDREQTRIKADENSAVGWFPIEEAVMKSAEPWMRERIYRKLNEKLKKRYDVF